MIQSSPFVKLTCVAAASLFVAGAASLNTMPARTALEGGGEVLEAHMGNSFADMSIGTLSALEPQQITPPLPARQPVPATTPPVPAQPVAAAATTATVTAALVPALSAPSPALQTITAAPQAAASPARSSRPKQRDPVLAAQAPPPKPVAKPKAAQKPAQSRGDTKRAATKGTPNGTKKAPAATQGKKKTAAAQSGTSAKASKYPGQVMRRIARVSKPRVNSRGTAVVAFSVSSSGGLTQVTIARSSGSAKLDQAAVRVIRKAAPFPAPPRGAQRSFSIRIKGQ
jgi:protein TonB